MGVAKGEIMKELEIFPEKEEISVRGEENRVVQTQPCTPAPVWCGMANPG